MKLRYAADIRTLIFVAAFFVGVVLAWLYTPTTWWGLTLTVVGLSWLSFTCAVITHNTVHSPIFKSRRANRAFQYVLTLAYGHPVSAYVPGHNLSHHCHTQSAKDVMRTTKLRYRWNLLNQLLFMPTVGSAIFKADLDYAKAMHTRKPAWFKQWVREWLLFIVATVAVLVLDWRSALLFVIIPHAFAAWGIVGINFAQHDGCDQDHEFNHSRNFTSPLLNWFLFNNGYHGIHHHHPALHWSLTAEAHEREIAPHVHPNLNQASMGAYFWRSLVWPGKRLDYLGNPVVLPEPVADESWIPGSNELPPGVSLGAES